MAYGGHWCYVVYCVFQQAIIFEIYFNGNVFSNFVISNVSVKTDLTHLCGVVIGDA